MERVLLMGLGCDGMVCLSICILGRGLLYDRVAVVILACGDGGRR